MREGKNKTKRLQPRNLIRSDNVALHITYK